MLKQMTADFRDTGDAKRMLAEVGKLDAARHIVPLLGAGAIVVWLAAQLLFLDGSVTFMGTMKVALISVLATGLVWAVSGEQLRLLRELERQGKELKQRTRETGALNRMAQAHLAGCPSQVPVYLGEREAGQGQNQRVSAPAGPAQLPIQSKVVAELRQILGSVPESDEYVSAYLEAAD